VFNRKLDTFFSPFSELTFGGHVAAEKSGHIARNFHLNTISVDLVKTNMIFTDNVGNPENYSGYSQAYFQIYSPADNSLLLNFSSSGSTYQIDISQRNIGVFVISCNSIPLSAGEYIYKMFVTTPTQRQTIMYGKFIIIF
jgi:hypothetical protein